MLEEAVHLIRELWRGGQISHRGRHYTVNARIYTLPEEPIEINIAAGGAESAELAGRSGGGIISTAPDGELLDAYVSAGGRAGDLPRSPSARAESRGDAVRRALEWWPNAGLRGPLTGAAAAEPLRSGGRDGLRIGHRRSNRVRARS